jgi:hypothetical protein
MSSPHMFKPICIDFWPSASTRNLYSRITENFQPRKADLSLLFKIWQTELEKGGFLEKRGQRSEELIWDWLTENEGKNQFLYSHATRLV